MLIIIDRKIPEEAKQALASFGELMELETKGITYEAVSGHPDIFFFREDRLLIMAPNVPKAYKDMLKERKVKFYKGEMPVGKRYPETACYNAVIDDGCLIHNLILTDPQVFDQVVEGSWIHVPQGYTRCNLISLGDRSFITSDRGILKELRKKDFRTLYTDPQGILLPGFSHGFIGGTCGILGNRIFFIGSLWHYAHGNAIREFIRDLRYEVVELYDGPLFDGGGVIFLE